jgi:excisionase family DNA binding protein
MTTRKPTAAFDAFWTPKELAEYLNLKTQTLALWRATGRHGLPFVRCGSAIRYRKLDVEKWLAERSGTSCAQVAMA